MSWQEHAPAELAGFLGIPAVGIVAEGLGSKNLALAIGGTGWFFTLIAMAFWADHTWQRLVASVGAGLLIPVLVIGWNQAFRDVDDRYGPVIHPSALAKASGSTGACASIGRMARQPLEWTSVTTSPTDRSE